MMSLENACNLANTLGNPTKNKTICLFHTGRAGSTLMAQIFHKTGRVRVLSMPDCYQSLLTAQDALSKDEKGYYALMMTRLLCKPVQQYRECETILIKMKSFEILMIPIFQEYVSWVQNICLYRNGLSAVLSMERKFFWTDWDLVFRIDWLKHLFFTLNMYPYYGKFSTKHVDSNFLLLSWRHQTIIAQMIKFQKKYKVHTTKFEDLITNPTEVIRDVFINCGLSIELVSLARTALNQHSQENSKFLGGESRYRLQCLRVKLRLKSDLISKYFKLPPLDADFRM